MPLYVKVLMRTALNRIGGRDGKDTGDWIVLTTTKTRDDLKSFYTSERMAANGWDKIDKYYFSAWSKSGEGPLDAFMQAFPF